ncbi:hypothetical protein [Dermatobacter hominis]|uniref:hypothetical protein n=1 Tax=Dermatobacter hominis TaxID=2884263 RepID=UPI001D12EB40|nr:hypothetical protein [Dermatobacter hominis]UDY34046.1 hypothetical protein LH044_11890 [Dermatobacter hominis]
MPSTGHFPPPSRPDERFQAVVDRGARLQRRDRMTKGLVTGGIAAVVVLVVLAGVFALSGGTSDDDSPVASSTTEATTTLPQDELTVAATDVGGAVEVDVDDPVVGIASTTKACAHVRLQGEGPAMVAKAEGSACWNPAEGDALTEASLQIIEAEIGCSASVERPEPGATVPTTVPGAVHHTFRFTLPQGLEPGTYVAEVTGVLGVGDGCPTSTPGDDEEVAPGTTTVEVP